MSKRTDSVHNIVILGGSIAGLGVAHYLLKHTIPTLSSASSIDYKVTLVSPSAYFYWKIGAPRAIVAPELLPIEKQFIRIVDGFKQYPASRFEFVQAAAVSLDPTTRTVVATSTEQAATLNEKNIPLSYDTLVIATGVTQPSPLFVQHGTDASTRTALKDMHNRIPSAETILIAGGGPAGVETAGELGSAYRGSKNIVLLSGTDRLISNIRSPIGHDAEHRLAKMGIKTIHKIRVSEATEVVVGGKTKTKLRLSDGSERTVDVYISAVGDQPNTTFLPPDWLNDRGYVKTNAATLRLDVPGTVSAGVYAIGSAASYSHGGILDIMYAVRPLAETIRVDLFAQLPPDAQAKLEPHKPFFPLSLFKSSPPPASEHKLPYKQQTAEFQIVPIGRKQGVGVLFGYRVPSWFVWMIKGRTYFIENAAKTVNGDTMVKA